MRRNWLAVLGLLTVLVLAAAACGSGDDGGSDDGGGDSAEESSTGRDRWVDQVSGLCEDWVDEVEDVDGTDPDEVAELGETTADFHDEVEDLEAPEDLADDAEDFVDTLDGLADYSADAAESLESNDGQGVDADIAEEGADLAVDLLDAAEALDLDCDLSVIDQRQSDFSDELSDLSDGSDDFSDDLSEGGFDSESLDPAIFIPEFGTDADLDDLAINCEAGDFAACDQLYFDSPFADSTGSYEGYGATCGGRLAEEDAGNCQDIAAGG